MNKRHRRGQLQALKCHSYKQKELKSRYFRVCLRLLNRHSLQLFRIDSEKSTAVVCLDFSRNNQHN